MHTDIQQIKEKVGQKADLLLRLNGELGKVVVGQEAMVSRLLVGLLTDGHVLLEGVPGLAKTTVITALAQAPSVDFSRIQFTPDLLPADLIGTMIYVPGDGSFPGPLNMVYVMSNSSPTFTVVSEKVFVAVSRRAAVKISYS